jgi:phage-related protein
MQSGLTILTNLWDKHLKGLVKQVLEFVAKLVNGALEIYNKFISPIANYLIKTLGPVFTTVFGVVMKIIGAALGNIFDFASGLFKALGGVIDFVTGVFTGNWSKAWNGVKDIFGGVFNSLYTLVKTPMNWIIDMINSVIGGLNKISIDIPKWVPNFGGSTFGINIPKLPHLAKGGITNGPTIAMIGDNPGGQEVVSPLDKLEDLIASAVGTAVMQANQFNNKSTSSGDIVIKVDGSTLARIINPHLAQEKNRIGGTMIVAT